MKYFILTGLFFTLTQFVYSETLTMIYKDYPNFCKIVLLSDDPVRKKFNSSSGFYGSFEKKIKPNANESKVEEHELAKECWGELLGEKYYLESVLGKLYELGYKPKSAYFYEKKDSTWAWGVHTFIFEKN
jgi:hypothetical protein